MGMGMGIGRVLTSPLQFMMVFQLGIPFRVLYMYYRSIIPSITSTFYGTCYGSYYSTYIVPNF